MVLLLYFRLNFTQVALLDGYHVVGAAVASVFVTSISVKYGKRFLYIFATGLLVASSAWGGAATSYKSLCAARAVQGVALAPFEAMVNASVGDMYFVHV